MKMTEIQFAGRQPPIDGYGPGGFRVGGAWHEGALFLSVRGRAEAPARLDAGAIAPVIEAADEIDVLLVGLGPEIGRLAGPLRETLEAAGIGVEAMATPSACRTYNVLLAEERRVAALLLPI